MPYGLAPITVSSRPFFSVGSDKLYLGLSNSGGYVYEHHKKMGLGNRYRAVDARGVGVCRFWPRRPWPLGYRQRRLSGQPRDGQCGRGGSGARQ